ncbi:MAG TPA: hypothetical protein VFO38_00430 [Candidatus Saccharimonadales bacterium]|nr:hypothetical protein [Candidatus Saccharimonadales bacterium]
MSASNNTVKIMALTVILAVVLVGGALAVVIVNNNMQRDTKAADQVAEQKRKTDEAQAAQSAAFLTTTNRNACLKQADDNYWNYVKLNATSTTQTDNGPVYKAYQNVWDTADSRKKTDTDNCYKQYPN